MKTKYRWIAQDDDGQICHFSGEEPWILGSMNCWANNEHWTTIASGEQNPNWQNTLIDLEIENYKIVDGILERRPKKVKLTDTQLLDAIVEHKLCVDITYTDAAVSDGTGRLAFNKKGNIRKAIKKWLKENVDKKHKQE